MKAEGEPEDRLPPLPYLPGGLLPRPPPEGLPVWLGAFSSCAYMVFLLVMPRILGVRGPGAYLAYVWWNRFDGMGDGYRSQRPPPAKVTRSFFGYVGLEHPVRFVGHPRSVVGIVKHLFDLLA